jgi:hypothetical protein
LFIKRTSTNDGGVLSFYRPDFDQMLLNWTILREVESWNEKGFVDVGEAQARKAEIASSSGSDPVEERLKWAKALESWRPAAIGNAGPPKLRTGDRAKGELWCSVCMSVLQNGQKNCGVCGAEVEPSRS